LRFVSLGSGSRGNATLVEAGGCRLLLDCGFSLKELERRLAAIDVEPESLDALLITHEHADHLRGVAAFQRRYRPALWMSHGTWLGSGLGEVEDLHLFHADQGSFRIGDLSITPFTVPHDAREPCQYRFEYQRLRLGVLTDAGAITSHIQEVLDGVDALILESNHDPRMLAQGPYPPSLKRRVGGSLGHLSNLQAAEFLAQLGLDRLQRLVMAHLSEKNNCPGLARETLLGRFPQLEHKTTTLLQDEVSGWFDIIA
jgi:phosphoribosyl 1,2-cyclic phosphodiesterase